MLFLHVALIVCHFSASCSLCHHVLILHALYLFICSPNVCSATTATDIGSKSACFTRELLSCLRCYVDVAVRHIFKIIAAVYSCFILFSASAYHIQSCCSFQNRPPAVQGSPNNGQPPPCMSPALMNAPWVREWGYRIFFSLPIC